MKTIAEIKTAIQTVLKKIKVSSGYSVTLTDNNFYKVYSPQAMQRADASKYPKVFIQVAEGNYQHQPSSRHERHLRFYVILVVLATAAVPGNPGTAEITATTKIDALIEDMARVIEQNPTLENTVQECSVDSFGTDNGALNQEGVAVFVLDCVHYYQR